MLLTNMKCRYILIETQFHLRKLHYRIITLTFVFVLSNYIYNFYGMLIQDFAVWDVMEKTSYIISIIILTGLKINNASNPGFQRTQSCTEYSDISFNFSL